MRAVHLSGKWGVLGLIACFLMGDGTAQAQNKVAIPQRVVRDLEFANVDGTSLKLDLYLPQPAEQGRGDNDVDSPTQTAKPPLVVWIHGGGWRSGSKERCFLKWLTNYGYAVASLSYRLTDKATFPAQIYDCKAGVRWLRAHAEEYGYRSDKIAVAGSSAGGHLATLLGTSGDVAALEGEVGGALGQSSRVDAIIDFYGPVDFELRSQSHPARANAPDSTTARLLGGGADKQVKAARQASPVTYVSADDPPLLIFHGDQDNKVLLDQSYQIQKFYHNAGLDVALHIIAGAGHGGDVFYQGKQQELIVSFLDKHLRTTQTTGDTAAHHLLRATPESQGVDSASIRAFIQDADQQIHDMHSFMLLKHGKVIAEHWWSPETPETPHILWSLSKSFTSTAVGLAVAEGKLDIDDKVLKFFPDAAPPEPSENLQAMRVRDLLTMSTGHAAEPNIRESDNWVQTFLHAPVEYPPGTVFRYNTPATFMQSAIVQKVTGETVLDYLTPRLFEPLGIKKPVWDTSPKGYSIGGYGLYLRTEDIAKFGQLYLQQGSWNGEQLIPAEWVKQATRKQVDNSQAPSAGNPDWREGYGFQFWRCRHNAYRGDGKDGQFCIVLPEHDAVIAITAKTGNMQAQLDLVWQHVLPALSAEPKP